MKKILLSAAAFAMVAASAIAVAPNTAQAIPAFARQTGMACYACHFQSFPALAEFGRSFKRDAFTDVGSEALVEDDNLSIPAVLNAALALHANYANVNDNAAGANTAAPGFKKGIWSLPIEAPLMLAGRVGKNVGAFIEFDGGSQSANGSPAANWQVMSSFDMGNFRMGLNAFDTSFGYTAGIETFNTFGQHDGVLNGGDVSAVVNIGNGNDGPGAATVQTEGLTLWAGNDLWFAALTGWSPMPGAGASNIGFSLIPGIRVAVTPNIMGWDTEIGGGWTDGTAGGGSPGAGSFGLPIATPAGTKVAGANLWFIDAQAQGSVGNTSVGIYADYAHTKAKSNVAYNVFGALSIANGVQAGTPLTDGKTDGFSIRATIKPIPQWVFEAGYGQTKYTPAVGNGGKNKIWQIGGQYELYQNFNLKLMYEDQKLDPLYPTYTAPVGGGSETIKTTTFELDALM